MLARRWITHSRSAVMVAAIGVAGAAAFTLTPLTGSADTTPSFGATYVDTTLAGGEPFVIYSHAGSDLVYAAHEGTTHIDRSYIGDPDNSCDVLPPPKTLPTGYACSYNNHINQWYSTDSGKTWTYESVTENPLYASTVPDTGFSDPSLTEDAPSGGTNPQLVYDTGIDLANDALYGSADGGKTWGGTPDCVQGDRPWLAGGQNGEVFLATDLEGAQPGTTGLTSGHAYFHGRVTEAGGVVVSISCNPNGIQDPAGGDAQDYYDHNTGDIVEGASGFSDHGFGIGVLPNASSAWPSATADPSNTGTPTGSFTDSEGTDCSHGYEIGNPTAGTPTSTPQTDAALCTELGPIDPEIAIDQGNNVYVVWATGPYSSTTGNGCSSATAANGNAIEPNAVYMMYTTDEGKSWSHPLTIADPTTTGGTTALWPFITAGAAGNVSVAWYQSNQLTDPDCDSAALLGAQPTQWTIRVANIFNATSASTTYPPASINAVPNFDGLHPTGVMHVGGICQSGTTCVATGQDRRLGDYFTNALDQNGCVMIATGDTVLTDTVTGDQFATSRPLFLQQASGPSLTTGQECTSALATQPGSGTPEAPVVPALAAAGLGVAGAVALRRRRRAHLQH